MSKQIKCPVCGQKTDKQRYADELISDVRNLIYKGKRFKCQHCGGVFGNQSMSGKRKAHVFDKRHTR